MSTRKFSPCLVPANAFVNAACCTDDRLFHFAARSSRTSPELLNSFIEARRSMPTFFNVNSTSDNSSFVPSSSINSSLPALISFILVKIVLNELPMDDISFCVTSPTVARYPNSLSIDTPALFAVTAVCDMASANAPELTAAFASIEVNLSTIFEASSTLTP